MFASEVKDALRRRHPAAPRGTMTGQWTCIEELRDVDLLAVNAWRAADVVGYEVKVSRSDMRSELLAPTKRAGAVAMCTEFYFAVPAGMLKPGEIAYVEPEWGADDWHRVRCLGVPCPKCGSKGYHDVSRVESEAPTLWVPRDVGLIEVTARGCRTVRKAPRRMDAPGLIDPAAGRDVRRARQDLNHVIRWVSNRPDPRHLPATVYETRDEVTVRQRRIGRDGRQIERWRDGMSNTGKRNEAL